MTMGTYKSRLKNLERCMHSIAKKNHYINKNSKTKNNSIERIKNFFQQFKIRTKSPRCNTLYNTCNP